MSDKVGRSAVRRNIVVLYGIAAFAVFAGCGGGGGKGSVTPAATASPTAAASATATPTASPTPIPLIATPATVSFGGVNGSQQISITERGFAGRFTAVSNDTTIVTVAPASVTVVTTGSTPSTGTFVLTSIGIGTNSSGATTLTISDGTLTIAVPVTVSVTSGIITYQPAYLLRLN